MAIEDIKYFNVKNISVRLVHIGGVAIPPEHIVSVVDDAKGINRLDVASSEYLEETDEGANGDADPTEVAPKKKPAAKTATGSGWTAKS